MSSRKPATVPFVGLINLKKLRSLARKAIRKLTGRGYDAHLASMPRAIPKKIWIFWDSGEAGAPPIVRACIASWRDQNPGWEVTVLDACSAETVVDMPPRPETMPIQAYCDLLRLRLLRRHGGVWADATLYCLTPLDHWLPQMARSGFFMFVWNRPDAWFLLPNVLRTVTNWFLASEPDGTVVSIWEEASFGYWEGRKAAHIYYWPHVLFEYLLLTDGRLRRAWRRVPRIGAYPVHLVHDYVVRDRDRDTIRAALATGAAPMQKLRWNWPEDRLERAREVFEQVPLSGRPPDR